MMKKGEIYQDCRRDILAGPNPARFLSLIQRDGTKPCFFLIISKYDSTGQKSLPLSVFTPCFLKLRADDLNVTTEIKKSLKNSEFSLIT
jgi:hypothetical protein